MEFGDGRHSSQLQLSNYFPAQNHHHEEKLKQAVMELFSETYRSKSSSSSARFDSVHKEKIKKIIEARLPSMFPAIFDTIPNHPPYAVMVMAAIRDLNEKRGSKKESISKYIKEHYENLPWAHPTILETHLENLVETGEILYVSKSRYRLPKSPDPEPNPSPKHEQQPKRKRGREPEQQVVRSLYEDDDGWIAIPKSKRTPVVECLEKQMPGRCLRPEQVEQQKTVEKSGFNEDVVTVHEKEPLRLTFKLNSKQNSRGRGRPPKKRNAEQVEQQKPVGETESNEDRTNQQPADGMQVEVETKEDCSDQNSALGIIVENETNQNGLAGIEEIKEQPPVEEGDINLDLSNHHSMGMEVENQTDEDGLNHHVTVVTEAESETNDDGTKQHLMIEQEEQQSPVEKIDMNEDSSVVFEHVEQQHLVVEGSDTYIKEDGSSQHCGIKVGIKTRENVSKLHVAVGTEVEWETTDDRLKQLLTNGIEHVEEQPPAENPDANEDVAVVIEHLDQPQPVVEGSDFNEDGSNQHLTGGIEVGTETKEDVSKLDVTVGTEVGWETNDDCLDQHLKNGIEQVAHQLPAEKPDVNEDGSVVLEHVEQPQPVVEGSDINEVGSNHHPTGGVEVGTEANKDENLHITVDAAVESETNADGLRQHLIDGIEQVEHQLPAEKPDVNEDGSVVLEHVEQPQPVVEGSDINVVGSNQHPTGGVEVGTEANKDGNLHITVDAAVESETNADGLRQHLIDGIEQVEQPPPVEKIDSNKDGSVGFEQVEEQQPVEGSGISQDGLNQHPTFGIEKQDTEQVELQKPIDESKSNEDGMNQHPTSGIEGTPLQQVKSGGRPPEKNKLRMQQEVVNDVIELTDDIDGLMVQLLPKIVMEEEAEPVAVTKEEEPKPVRQTRGMVRKKCTLEQQQAMSDAVEPGDGNGAKVVVAVTEEVEPVAVTKEEKPKPVRQTRGMARKKCTLEQQQAMSDAVEPRDGNDAKVVVAVTEEVEPVAVTKKEEPKPVRQTRGMARKKCALEQQQAMIDAVEPGDGNDAKVMVAVTEEVEPAAVTKEEEPKPVRHTRGKACKKCTPEQHQAMSDAVEPREGNGAKVEVAVTEEVDPMDLTKEEEPRTQRTRGSTPKVCTPEQQQQAMSDATEPTADNDATIEVAVKEDEGKLHLRRRGQGGQGRERPPKKHVRGPQQEEEIFVVAEEEQKPHGRGGRQRGVGREETVVVAAEKVQKPYGRGGRQRGRGQEETMVEATEEEKKACVQGEKPRGRGPQKTVVAAAEEEKKPCGQGGKQRGRGSKETVVVVEEEEQKSCGLGRGRERGREETMRRKRNKTHVDEDKVERKQWWQKRSNKSHVDKEEVEREVEGEERL